MSETMECQFCKKTFTTRNILLQHQKRAKYCLELQGAEQSKFECKYCKKQLSTNERLISHISSSCKEKKKQENVEKEQKVENNFNEQKKYYEEKLNEKKDYISKLEATISKLEATISKLETKLEKFEDSILSKTTEKKPITTNHTTNNTTNIVINTLNLNDIPKMTSFLEEKLDKYVLVNGQKGLATLLSSTILKGRYKCVDPSRQNFEFTNELGEVERDVKAKKLTNALIKSDICAKSCEKGQELWKKDDGSTDSLGYQAHFDRVLEMINFNRDNSTFRSELSALTS